MERKPSRSHGVGKACLNRKVTYNKKQIKKADDAPEASDVMRQPTCLQRGPVQGTRFSSYIFNPHVPEEGGSFSSCGVLTLMPSS